MMFFLKVLWQVEREADPLEGESSSVPEKCRPEGPPNLVQPLLRLCPSPSTTDCFILSAGGVVLSSLQGKIVCNNTLDVRLQYAYDHAIPEVREKLFADIKIA